MREGSPIKKQKTKESDKMAAAPEQFEGFMIHSKEKWSDFTEEKARYLSYFQYTMQSSEMPNVSPLKIVPSSFGTFEVYSLQMRPKLQANQYLTSRSSHPRSSRTTMSILKANAVASAVPMSTRSLEAGGIWQSRQYALATRLSGRFCELDRM
jgi:hypothetical protein